MSDVLGRWQDTHRSSRVSEHVDSKLVTNSTCWVAEHATVIREKRRPLGRPNNPSATAVIEPDSLRCPLNFGDVNGAFHSPPRSIGSIEAKDGKVKSSRRGKEQIRSRSSGGESGTAT